MSGTPFVGGVIKTVEIDWDDDGLTDYEENGTYGTGPLDRDSDDDGLFDGEEAGRYGLTAGYPRGSDPLLVDTDKDGLSDGTELGLSEVAADERFLGTLEKTFTHSDSTTTQHDIDTTALPVEGLHAVAGLQLYDSDPDTTTNPRLPDTDGDGYWDGPDAWVDAGALGLLLRAGEDRNGNGTHEVKGEDEILGSEDDEADPGNSASLPESDTILGSDEDRDGIAKAVEDEVGLEPYDADSDDDGVKDGDEIYIYHTDPHQADTDHDGLPDGLELGLNYSSLGSGINGYNKSWWNDIDLTATYRYRLPDNSQPYWNFSFWRSLNPYYHSDPRSYDSDFDGVQDLEEFQGGGLAVMRGLMRVPDETTETVETQLRIEPPLYSEGWAPVNKDFKIYLNLVPDEEGRGRLGRIRFRGFSRGISQCSPEWLMKSMYEVAHQDPDRFAFIKQIAGEQSGLRNVFESVEYIQKNFDKILLTEGSDQVARIKYFADPEQIKRILTNAVDENGQRLFNDEFLGKIGEFWGKFYNVGVVNKLGKRPSGIASVVSSINRYARTFGQEVLEAAERVNWEKFK